MLHDRPWYSRNIIGRRVQVGWQGDQKFYVGRIVEFDVANDMHGIVYDDGEQRGEPLNHPQFVWEFAEDGAGATGVAAPRGLKG